MRILIHTRKAVAAGVCAAAIAVGGAAAVVSPATAMPTQQQSCPATGLIYVCGEYNTQAECTEALNARGGYIDGSTAWCDEPGPTSAKWRLIASISG